MNPKFDATWLVSLPTAGDDAQAWPRTRWAIAAQAALLLRDLGRHESVDQIIGTLASQAAADSDEGRRWSALAKLQWQLARYDDALASAALAANTLPASQVFVEFIKPQAAAAGVWFGMFRDIDPLIDRQKAISDAVWLSVPRPPAGKEVADWRQRVEGAVIHVRKLEPKVRAAYLSIIAETCATRGDRKLAREYYGEAAEVSLTAALKAGDLATKDADWTAAEQWYARAAAAQEGDALATFLHGRALIELGKQEEGLARQRLATFLPLSSEARWQLASGLQERGLATEAAAQFDIILRTAPLDSSLVVNASQQLGNLISGKEPLRAADYWQHLQLHVLNSSSNFVEIEGYLTLPHVMHKVRAKGLLESGQFEAALAELAACQRLLPGDVRLVEEFVPKLDQAGHAAEADKIFEAAHDIHAKIALDYPTSATHLNNTAWISARSRRKLDEALALAQKAIELAPREAAYCDTLAEVHFQRGDRPAAIAAAKQALALSPASSLYEKRLKHFEQDEMGVTGDKVE